MISNCFRIVDRQPIPEGGLGPMRYRLTHLYGQSFWVRVGDADSPSREVWESPEGQRFSIIANRRGTKLAYTLVEVAYNEHEVIQRSRAQLKHKLVTRITMQGEDPR